MDDLEAVTGLLGRWRAAPGPTDRLQVVTEAARVLRDLPDVERDVLARKLLEHGAPAAAEQIARHTGRSVSGEELEHAAQALLSVEGSELDRLASELRNPVPKDVPPPPGAVPDPPVRVETPEAPAPRRVPAPRPSPSAWRRDATDPVTRYVDALAAAANGRERLQLLDAGPDHLDVDGLARVLRAVPDGWQRRTVLRRLLDAGRVGALSDVRADAGADVRADAGAVVAAFQRRGDRFAAAASLARHGLATTDTLVAGLDARDAQRLRRRMVHAAASGGQPVGQIDPQLGGQAQRIEVDPFVVPMET